MLKNKLQVRNLSEQYEYIFQQKNMATEHQKYHDNMKNVVSRPKSMTGHFLFSFSAEREELMAAITISLANIFR